MKAAIHQPNFIPWLGYMNKIAQADVFIFLDTVQYNRRGLTNNNKIKTPNGELSITMPVIKGVYAEQKVSDVLLFDHSKSAEKICRTIEANYKKANYFDVFYPEFRQIMFEHSGLLMDLNMALIKWGMKAFNIKTDLKKASDFEIILEEDPSERLIRLTKAVGCNEYITGKGGFNYQDEERFHTEGIKLTLPTFNPPPYVQLWGAFIPNLSFVDALFNCGNSASTFFR